MRKFVIIFLSVIALSSTIGASIINARPIEASINLTPTKYKNLFVCRVQKRFIGAHIEVVSATGDCITCQTLTRRKLILNLRDAHSGTYTLKIKKDGVNEELQFIKK